MKDEANRSKYEETKEDQVTWSGDLACFVFFPALLLIVLTLPCGWRCFSRIVEEWMKPFVYLTLKAKEGLWSTLTHFAFVFAHSWRSLARFGFSTTNVSSVWSENGRKFFLEPSRCSSKRVHLCRTGFSSVWTSEQHQEKEDLALRERKDPEQTISTPLP